MVHLHDELRRAANGRDAGPSTAESRAGRVRLIEHAVPAERGESLPTIAAGRRSWYIAGAAAVAAGLLIFGLVRRIETRLNDASARVAAAERQADAATERATQEMTDARQEANRQIAEARESAQRAETVSAILAAPNLVRINLTGGAIERSSRNCCGAGRAERSILLNKFPPALGSGLQSRGLVDFRPISEADREIISRKTWT